MKVRWNTNNNHVDCGIFAMRHMECYMGQPDENWSCDLPIESGEQVVKLRRLRHRYAAKILSHEMNEKSKLNLEQATDFISKYDQEEVRNFVIEAQKNRDERKF